MIEFWLYLFPKQQLFHSIVYAVVGQQGKLTIIVKY